MRLSTIALCLTFGIFTIGGAAAQSPSSNEVEGVIVTPLPPQTPRDRVASFGKGEPNGQLPVWVRAICPISLGLNDRERLNYVTARVRQVAEAAGLKVGPAKCRPNVMILFSNEPIELLQAMSKKRRSLFGDPQVPTLRRFINDGRPVRWWTNTVELPANGGDSRAKPQVFAALSQMIIVVDARTAEGVKLRALANYVAMTALTRPDPRTDHKGQDTIMALFDKQGRADDVGDLTSWDLAYLQALYATDPGQHLNAQIGDMVNEMNAILAPPPPAPKPA